MPPSSTAIRKTVQAYLGRHPGERDALAELLAALDRPVDTTARTTLPGHVTCSAVVIDRQARVLHIRHRATGGLMLAPGGHIEPQDRTLLAVALREVTEEAGIPPGALCLTRQLLGTPIDIDVHDIDASPSKGEPAHRHYDVRYVFYLSGEEPPTIALQDEEVSGAQWLPQPEVTSPTLRAKLLAADLDGLPEPVNASALIHDGPGTCFICVTTSPASSGSRGRSPFSAGAARTTIKALRAPCCENYPRRCPTSASRT
ncbi:NUDIX hydrolase [Streptomyces sp. NRRL F-5650]|uniref:NUDIX hydrolase n=1 Tax=Streptomyces sp. NRRL F-5650 TaxID=1463868 RepID=UPI000A69E5F1|nr:NUDIX domain-containing protein [Streptomyces sp. NRRL F-5650]